MDKESRPIAAICHGPWVLISAGIVQNRMITGYDSIQIDLRNAGANIPAEKVFVDGNIVSAVHYRNNAEFMKAVVALLGNAL
jgi:protease I